MAPSVTRLCRSVAFSTWLVSSLCSVHLLCLDFTVAEKEEWYTAFVNMTYLDPVTSHVRTERTECGRYGEHSPKREARGLVAVPSLPQERQMCDPAARFPPVTRTAAAWVALVAAGNCTYREKIRNAAGLNASAVVVYNVGSSGTNDTITMPHSGTGEVVAIMIPEHKGREIVALLEQHVAVTLHITVGTRNLQKYVSRTSVVFVSISFIILMIISLAWLVFYYIQRFRYVNARDRNQRRLGDAAKKAIGKLQVRTIKKGDKETDRDFDSCAVCIEAYKPNDVVRVLPCRHVFHKHCVDPWLHDHQTCPMCKMNILKALGISLHADGSDEMPADYEMSVGGPSANLVSGASDVTVNESSVVLDVVERETGPHQHGPHVEIAPRAEENYVISNSEQQLPVSSDSDSSISATRQNQCTPRKHRDVETVACV
ncbi:RING finger protein 150a isoform X1 [Entelurus aequoreus]|uniref:RING finger protein 150a isoform X1 n=1 Tax=Entelurus aequoreus TaxID=161455 RepID=UPI002B1D2EE3|nr:RING finger protein 150a isoform X1 [Entelurus aequoreus]XP_061888301.1 RING finger protein 150a isoform X1 [Entelurus aequoreus]XP_061888302.1 RING finger protein 150a isoform X1 [Entelurus aequoreus]XP_061888303.1 RING finger protein 150a isoform X1 [Entelurus aequoreus]XP_061888304.1 RING finger protein 150a isoform X1 [Entelurus aequoreus]XP_061888305.1 RING finger protein 150a isoform X1 [Entelurus aequoreus]